MFNNSASAFSFVASTLKSSYSFILSSISLDCSLAFLIAIDSTIAATSGYSFAHVSNSSSDFGNLISFLAVAFNCFSRLLIFSSRVFCCCCWCLRKSPYLFLKLFSSAPLGSSSLTSSVCVFFCSSKSIFKSSSSLV